MTVRSHRILMCAGALLVLLAMQPKARAEERILANSFGAKGDGVTLDTRAIQAALDAAAKHRHTTVAFTPGVYRTGALFVKSGTTLEIDAGVTLRAVHGLANYPMIETRIAGIDMHWPAAVINVYRQHDVRIRGNGTVDGDGKYWWNGYWALRHAYDAKGLRWAADYDDRRPRLIEFYKSTNVALSGLHLLRSPFWTVHICYSEHVHVNGITIRNNIGGRGPSTDGVDIDSSRHVLVEHADISVNDDALCLKSGRDSDGLRVNKPDEDIVIRDCTVRDGAAAFTIGSETSGGFRNVDVYNIHAFGHVPSGVLFKSARTRGGWADNIRIHNLQLDGVAVPIHITMNWNPSYSYARIPPGLQQVPRYYRVLAAPVPASKGLSHFRNVRIWNLKATNAKTAFEVSAMKSAPLVNFRLSHIHIEAQNAGSIADTRAWTLSNDAVQTRDGSRVKFTNARGTTLIHSTGFSPVKE
jgi:polygalacturonase